MLIGPGLLRNAIGRELILALIIFQIVYMKNKSDCSKKKEL